jgi:very-short-patch-repair endonuclease
MADLRTLAPNVERFLDDTTANIGKLLTTRWNEETYCDLLETGCESPIEDLFYIASVALCKAAFVDVNPEPFQHSNGLWDCYSGVFFSAQYKVDKYRIDFFIKQHGIGPQDAFPPVLVELDGHEFHDKDKRQRSYEKARDRFLIRKGFRLLHYTGSDVVADPFKCAFEALETAGAFAGSGVEYNPDYPLGTE